MTWSSMPLSHQMPLQGRVHVIWIDDLILPGDRLSERWPNSTLGHKMSAPGVTAFLMGTGHLKRWPNSTWEQVIWKDDPISALCHKMSLLGWGQLIWGYTSSENMNSFWVLLLLHRGLSTKDQPGHAHIFLWKLSMHSCRRIQAAWCITLKLPISWGVIELCHMLVRFEARGGFPCQSSANLWLNA